MSDQTDRSDVTWLDRYLAGELSPDEMRAFADDLDSETQAWIRAFRAGVSEPVGTLPAFNVPVRSAAIVEHSIRAASRHRRHSISAGTVRTIPSPEMSPLRLSSGKNGTLRRSRVWITRVAAVCILAVVGLMMHTVVTPSSSPAVHTAMASTKVYRTGNGQRITITLPDRSTVLLGPASTLTVDPAFAVKGRVVSVSGEGYFVVQPDPAQPFLVNASGAVVRVLGTTFAVRRYPSDTQVRVVVADGRVSLRSRNVTQPGEAILSRGTLGVATDSGPIVVRSGIVIEDYTAWTSGELVFRDTPLREVLAELERQYDVNIRFTDSTQYDKPFNARFGQEPLEEILNALALAFDSRYTRSGRDGRHVTFTSTRMLRRIPAPARLPIFSPEEVRYGR